METRFLLPALVAASALVSLLAMTVASQDPPPAVGTAPKPAAAESNEKLPQPPLVESSYPLAAEPDRQKSAKLVQQVTVDLLATANIYKEAHWNLTGPLYLVLHEYYDTQATFYTKASDDFAERALHLGYSIDGRYSTVTRTTSLPEFPAGYLTDTDSVRLLVERVTALQKVVYKGIKETERTDPPTGNKLQDLAYAIDKNLWQLRVHLQKPGGPGETLPWTAIQGKAAPAPARK